MWTYIIKVKLVNRFLLFSRRCIIVEYNHLFRCMLSSETGGQNTLWDISFITRGRVDSRELITVDRMAGVYEKNAEIKVNSFFLSRTILAHRRAH